MHSNIKIILLNIDKNPVRRKNEKAKFKRNTK